MKKIILLSIEEIKNFFSQHSTYPIKTKIFFTSCLLWLECIFFPFVGIECYAQCPAMTQIAAGTYTSITLGSDSYIAIGDVVNVTGVFAAGSHNFCNAGTLNAGTFTQTTGGAFGITNYGTMLVTGTMSAGGTVALTNSGSITADSLTLTGANKNLINNTGAIITTTKGIYIAGATITNSGDITSTGGKFTATSASATITNNAGASIIASGDIYIAGTTNNSWLIQSTAGTFYSSNATLAFSNINGGNLKSYGDMTFNGPINNCGIIEITNVGKLTKAGTSYPITNSAGSSILIRGSGLTSQIEGDFPNDGIVKVEGRLLRNSSSKTLTNSSTGYIRVCEEDRDIGNITNSGTIEVLGQLYKGTSSGTTIINNAGAILNVSDDIDFNCILINHGCITVGDSIYHNTASIRDITNDGTIYTTNFIQNNGSLIGGASSAATGYLIVSGLSQTLNGVPLSGYLDLCDLTPPVNHYLDSESPVYAWPTANVTACGSAPPCSQATFASCSDALPVAAPTSCISALPIELLSFTAQCQDKFVELQWTTATEINNDYFTIQRSMDAVHFTVIANVKGAGSSSTQHSYSYIDDESLTGTSIYYRLAQTDFDGKSEYFKIIAAGNCKDGIDFISIYPNPSNGNFSYLINSSIDTEVFVIVYNMLGQKVIDAKDYVHKGIETHNIDGSSISNGIYYLMITTNNGLYKAQKQIVIQK